MKGGKERLQGVRLIVLREKNSEKAVGNSVQRGKVKQSFMTKTVKWKYPPHDWVLEQKIPRRRESCGN
jgi:hypothetical protein